MTVTARFAKGDNVQIISNSKIGTVNEVLVRSDNVGYRITVDGKVMTYQEKFLIPHVDEEQEILDALTMGEFSGAEGYRLFQTWFRLKRPIEGNFYSYLASRTTFNAYQFKPLSKFIASGSEERLFIADEVGVGKTIETGIILTELVARGRLDRKSPILIVCPNVLGPKWVKEMKQRFNLRFHLHDGGSLEHTLHSAQSGVLPDGMSWGVVGIQLLRNKKYMNLIQKISSSREAPLWSMVIVDESHHMRNPATESNNLGNLLSSLTEMMVMLSATPLNLRDEDLFQQMHILNPAMFPDLQTFNALLSPVKSINRSRRLLLENDPALFGQLLLELERLEAGPLGNAIASHYGLEALKKSLKAGQALTATEIAEFERLFVSLSPLDQSFTRTLKREAMDHRVTRETQKISVRLSAEEKTFHEGVVKVIEETYLASGGSPTAIGFITNMPRRMVSSCIPAMRQYLDWCLQKGQMLMDEDSVLEVVDDDSELSTVELMPEMTKAFRSLREQAVELELIDTKYAEFSKLIKQLLSNLENPQVIVFSFFVRTLEYLKKRLTAEGYRVGIISGKVQLTSDGTEPGRYEVIEAFENKELDILLSSEVGGEGLDFQFCQAVVNYDLPYNPMRIEQRIGRIDRFGQKAEKIVVANMYIEGTVDERIYSTLYERIRLIEDSVGIMEPILGNRLADLQREMISDQLSAEQLEVRMREIEIAVEQARMEYEKFESNRRELMGDEYFTSPLHNLEQQNDFVDPSDAARLTSICLSLIDGCGYQAVEPHRGLIHLSKEMVARLEQFTRRPGSEGSLEELGSLLSRKYPLPVIFNGSMADQFKEHVFLSPCGFWIRFLLNELEERKKLNKVFSVRSTTLKEAGFNTGQYVIPLFEVKMEGFRVELDLAAVPVRIADGHVLQCDFSRLSRGLGREVIEVDDERSLLEMDFVEYLDRARFALEQSMEEKMERLRRENEYRVEARMASLRRGSEVRISRWRKQVQSHQEHARAEGKKYSQEYIRLMDAQITNDEQRTEEKIEKLQAKKNLSLAVSLVGVVVLHVE